MRLNTRFANAHGVGHRWTIGNGSNPDWAAFKANVPSVFAVDAHESRSEQYGVVSTADMLRALWKEGWAPVSALEAAPRDSDKLGFQKHMVRCRRQDDLGLNANNSFRGDGTFRADNSGAVPELIIVNSFDGSTSVQMLGGVFEFVCANGMVVGSRFSEIRVPHRKNIVQGVVEAAAETANTFKTVMDTRAVMRGIELTAPERADFAKAAHALRFPVTIDEVTGERSGGSPISHAQLLQPKRHADNRTDLWTTFQVVQEHCIRGGDSAMGPRVNGRRGRRTTSREVGGIDQNVRLNRALWTLAEEAAGLKGFNLAA